MRMMARTEFRIQDSEFSSQNKVSQWTLLAAGFCIPASAVRLFLFCAFFAAAPVHAGFSKDDAGTAAAQVLKQGAGARAAAMGNAFAALADDASAVYWNPGGLASIRNESVSFMHAVLPEDISYNWLAYVQPLSAGAVGAGIQHMDYGNITRTDETGLETGDFTPAETVTTLSYGLGSGNFGLGAALKYISAEITRSASAIAADIGMKYDTSREEGVSLGAVLQNIGGKIKYVSSGDPLPFNFKFGAAYKPAGNWLFAADIDMPRDNAVVLGFGSEYSRKSRDGLTVSCRAGYSTRTKELGGLAGFTVGAGGSYESLGLDYAFVPFGSLGNTHKISLSIGF